MVQTVVQPSFSRGEMSPKVTSRIDIDQYGQGLATCKNFEVLVQGPMRKRSGTAFIAPTKDQSAKSHIIPFVFSSKQAYVLEFGNFYIRFFALHGQIKVSGVPYEIVSPYAIEDIPNIKFLEINDIIYLVHQKYPTQKLSRLGETNWTIAPVTFFNGPYLDPNLTSTSILPSSTGRPAGSGNPTIHWNNDDQDSTWIDPGPTASAPVFSTFTFSGSPVIVDGYALMHHGSWVDGSFEATNSEAPRAWAFEGNVPGTGTWVELDHRIGESGWIPGETRAFDFKNKTTAYQAYRFKFTKTNGAKRLTISELYLKVRDFPMTLTFSATTGINKGAGFTSDDIGRFIRFRTSDGFWKNLKITSVTNNKTVVGLFNGLWSASIASTQNWQLGSFSKFSGYPSAIADFEGRMALAGTAEEPRNVWLSSSTDLEDFAPRDPVVDAGPINVRLSGNQQNAILWLSVGKALFAGSTEAVTALSPGNDEPLTYKNIKQVTQTNFGANSVTPIRVGPAVLYVSYYGNCIRELLYAFSDDTYDAPDITMLSEHLLSSGIADMGWMRSPDNKLLIPTNNGPLVVMTYDRVQKVNALTPYETDGIIESVAIVPGADGMQDEAYFQVKRIINGVTKRYIEYQKSAFDYQPLDQAWLLDCALEYNGSYVNVLTGLSHLEGKDVVIFARGVTDSDGNIGTVPAIFGSHVAGGQAILPGGVLVNSAVVGLGYTGLVKTLPARIQDRVSETAYTKKTKVDRVVLDLLNTLGLEINGMEGAGTWEDVVERKPANPMDQILPLFTGLKDVAFENSWEYRSAYSVRSLYPLPATIRTLTSKLDRET